MTIPRRNVPYESVAAAAAAAPPANQRIAYGPQPEQFGELRLPPGARAMPVAVLIHGGCWRRSYDLSHTRAAAAALAARGFAVWTPEYRRVGHEGGGWPGTLLDVGAAIDHLRVLGPACDLDLDRVVVLGHSAGGHLALWSAGRSRLKPGDALYTSLPLRLAGVVGLAPITDLARYATVGNPCSAMVAELLGGRPEALPERVAEASPIALAQHGVPVRLVHGADDEIVPLSQSAVYRSAVQAAAGDCRMHAIAGASHFDVIAPGAEAWDVVIEALGELAGAGAA